MGAIVVGYDGSACGEAALDAALGLAASLGDEVIAVFGYAPPGIWGGEIAEHEEAISELGEKVMGRAREQAAGGSVPFSDELVAKRSVDALIERRRRARRADDRRRQLRRAAAQRRDSWIDPQQTPAPGRPAGAGRTRGGRLSTEPITGGADRRHQSRHRRPDGSVVLRNVTKRFDTFTAVDDISLELGSGEFFTLLGPSGCGKTTTLRMIAGFERPTAGEIRIEGEDVAALPPTSGRPTPSSRATRSSPT